MTLQVPVNRSKLLTSLILLCTLLLAGAVPGVAAQPTTCTAESQLPCYCKDAGLGNNSVAYNTNVAAPCFRGGEQNSNFPLFALFSAYSWSAFNWPVSEQNGSPDLHQDLRQVHGDNSTVWESWKTSTDVFLPDGGMPIAWSEKEHALPESCQQINLAAAKSSFPNIRSSVPDQLPPRLLSDYVNAEGDAVVDRNGEVLRFETIMNKVAYDYIVDNELYNTDGQQTFFDGGGIVNFPSGVTGGPEKRGSYLLKAAWKVLHDTERSDDIHKAWAYIYPVVKNGTLQSTCELRPVGLLGMHVTYKLNIAPEWVWGTFEHSRTAPTWDELRKDQNVRDDYFLYNGNCTADSNCAKINAKPRLFPKNHNTPQSSQLVTQQKYGYGFVCTVPDCRNSSVEHVNRYFAETLKSSVWANYRLKGTQWLDAGDNRIKPIILANTVIESYIQQTSSCMECHMLASTKFESATGHVIPNAQPSDNTFVLQKARPKISIRKIPPNPRMASE